MAKEEEIEIKDEIKELKKRMKDVMDSKMLEDDRMFYRFLKARDFNIDNAEIMLRNHLEWRKKYFDFETISSYKQPEVLEKHLPLDRIGVDKEGCVIRHCPCGNVDWIGLALSAKPEDFARRLIAESLEDDKIMELESKKRGKIVDKVNFIFNLDKFTFSKATNKKALIVIIYIGEIFQNNYPERLKAVYVINASSYFHLVFAVLKCFLAKAIIDKIKIYSDDSYKKDLLKEIDADVLPAFLGGKRTDPDGDPLCHSFIDHGSVVPEKYYFSKNRKLLCDLPDTNRIILKRSKYQEIIREVEESGSYLEWEFETKGKDVAFGVFYRETVNGKENSTELVSVQRVHTEDYAETGMYLCEKPGTYVILFDNSYSWIRNKEVFYRLKVKTPKEQERSLRN